MSSNRQSHNHYNHSYKVEKERRLLYFFVVSITRFTLESGAILFATPAESTRIIILKRFFRYCVEGGTNSLFISLKRR